MLDCWDLLHSHSQPILSRSLGRDPVRALDVNHDGVTVAAGDEAGVVSVVRLSEDLATASRTERTSLANMLDREAKRERILEVRSREINFLNKEAGEKEKKESHGDGEERCRIQKTEETFFTIINSLAEERKRSVILSKSSSYETEMCQ